MTTKEKRDLNKVARTVGILFIIGTVAGILSAVVTGPILEGQDYLTNVAANENKLILGTLFILIMGIALSMIPVVLYPIFKKQNEALALGAVVFRGALEAVAYIGVIISMLLLLTLSKDFVSAGSQDVAYFQSLGTLLMQASFWLSIYVSIVFSIGALMIYYLFYQSKLIPRWLSIWGFVGAIIYLAEPLLAMFGSEMEILFAPLALQEMVFAIWLIVKGFSPAVIDSESTS